MEITVDSIRQNLRIVRKIKGLTLKDVEALSNGRFKCVTVGSYERGDRNMPIKNLIGLASFYEVPLEALLYGKAEVVWSATEALVGETNRAI